MSETTFLKDAEATLAAGRELGAQLEAGAVVALVGELGAGKTHFSQGVAMGLGIARETVTSPTFTLVNEYEEGRLRLYHLDFYRLEQEAELDAIGWDDMVEAGGVTLAEWANLFPDVFPDGTIWVELRHVEGGRELSVR